MAYTKFEARPSDFDGDVTLGDNKEKKAVGTVKLWIQPQQAPATAQNGQPISFPKFRGYVMMDGKYYRLTLWDTP